ncbi:MAG: von Willebrand factor type A domain-containing protein [Prosthecobacter sp.]|uniref:YfbK domain-containing protein n=1 Tax=Prosthecobacter sp. TaxID=1965333 RepID=UPI002626C03A|nr:von Willebrand factor type A domain-containing protein [Prosthecobacter sp.]MCF7789982.1 von Willebrand factor type A domain-containing protein [Prosthecobacter sp.]
MKPEQITAWALDEASAEERQQLEAALLENPQDKLKADDTKAFCDFLLSELRDDSLALTDKQRERLVEQAAVGQSSRLPHASETLALQPEAGGKAAKTTRWNIGVIVRLSLAACAVLGGFWTWQAYSGKNTAARDVAAVVVEEKPDIKVHLPQKPEAKRKVDAGAEARLLVEAQNKALVKMEPQVAKSLAAAPVPAPVSAPAAAASALALNTEQRGMSPGDVERLKQVQDQNAYGLDFGGSIEGFSYSNAGVVAGSGVIAQRVEMVAVAAAPVAADGSGVLVGSGSMLMPQGTGVVTLNGGTAVTAGGAVSGSGGGRPAVTSTATGLVKAPLGWPAASLSLKAGFYPEQMVGYALTPNVTKIDGFINLYVPRWQDMNGLTLVVAHGRRVLVTPQKTGLVSCLLPGAEILTANGWPLMPQANPSVLAASGDLDGAGSLADFQVGVDFGDIGMYNRGSASVVLRAANASTGSILVQSGAPLTFNSIIQQRRWPLNAFSTTSSMGDRYFKGIGIGIPVYGWIPLPQEVNTNSPGLISFATAASSELNESRGSDSISTEDRGLLGGLLPRDQGLAVNPAALADASGVRELQAAVFNLNALRERVDLMGPPVVTTKAGTRATMIVTREFVYPTGAIVDESSRPRNLSEGEPAFGDTVANTSSGAFGRNSLAFGNMVGEKTIGENVVAGTSLSRSDVGELAKDGATSYTANNTFTGDVAINNGTARPSKNLSAPAPVNDDLGINVSIGYDSNYYAWRGAAAPAQAGVVTFSGVASGPTRDGVTLRGDGLGDGGLTKSGAGALVVTGAKNYTGATTVNGGRLTVTGGGAVMQYGDGLVRASGATEQLQRAAGATFNNNGGVVAAPSPAAPAAKPMDMGGVVLTTGNAADVHTMTTAVVGNPQAATAGATNTTALGLQAEVSKVQSGLMLANGAAETGNYDVAITQYQDVLRTDPNNAAARRGMETSERKRQEYFKTAYDHQRSKMLAQVDENWEDKVPVPGSPGQYVDINEPAMKRNVPTNESATVLEMKVNQQTDARYFIDDATTRINVNDPEGKAVPLIFVDPRSGESYTRIIENEMKEVAREPLSTLSIDVDTASYANVRRFLNQNMLPPPDAVRIEELVNYFPTSEEGPAHYAKEPFGVRVELAPCPWQPVHRLARIAIKGRELDKDRKASNLVFLVDVSGSMNEPAKLPLVQQSLRMLTEQLVEGDRVTMVVYAGSSGVVLPPTGGEKKEEILAAINRLSAGGSTHGSAGIKLAYEQAVAGFIKGGVNRVILCTDGDFNVGVSSPEELEKLIKHKAKTGVFLSVLGFGSGNLKDRTMETLADKGNGNYAYIDSLSEARKVLVEQMSGTLVTIAKDVKIQVEFNPAAVRSYRLIGYENRLLAKEDFNDDTKDAGEIGAGHSVVALYEVVPANLPPGAEPRPLVDDLKYQAAAVAPAQLAEAAKTGEMMTVKLRYKEPESDLSKLIEVPTKDEGKTLTASTEEFKFSAAVAGFGLLLRDSSYKGTLRWETVRRLALDGKGADKLGYRGEFLQLIDKARGLKETR